MGTKHFNFESYEDDVDAGGLLIFSVNVNDFKIDEDCAINSAALISEEGKFVAITSVRAVGDGNYFEFNAPDEIETGQYKFKISIFSISKPEDTAIIETLGDIGIVGDGGWTMPPSVDTLRFMNHSTTIPAADITGDVLQISGEHLNHVTSIKAISPSIFFNIIFHSKSYIKARAISAPRVQGLRLVYPRLEYTINNYEGEFVSSGEIRSNIPLRIQGD